MTNQRLVLEQITALNTTTANIIDSTGNLLKQNTAAIHEQAAGSTIPLDTLKRAFQNIYDTMDTIDAFKAKSLVSMKTTVDALSNEVEKSKGYIARAEGASQARLTTQQRSQPLRAGLMTSRRHPRPRRSHMLRRSSDAPALLARERARARKSGLKKGGRVLWAFLAILLVTFIVGLVIPIGTTGVMIAALVFVLAALGIVRHARRAPPRRRRPPHDRARTAPAQRPKAGLQDSARSSPPPPSASPTASASSSKGSLPSSRALDEREPAAAEIRRLIADELPELVKGYGRVPEPLRRTERDGMMPERQLVEGLQVVDAELARMSEQLARGDLEKLATQGKYLELKYQGEGLG